MAPFLTLFSLCVRSVVQLINKACESLAKKYQSYDIKECKRDITIIRDFLSSNVLVHTIDELYYKWTRLDIDDQHDFRIWFAAFLHKGMKRLTVFYGSNFYMQIRKLIPELLNSFWSEQLSYCECIVFLDLYCKCTDEILELVSQHCHLLEYIDITPMRKIVQNEFSYNAIDLVSNAGLEHLEKCKKLKSVIMYRLREVEMAVTVDGVRKLLKSLPLIKYMHFDHMGHVISEGMDDMETLPLIYFRETDVKLHHIAALSKVCRNVRHLSLRFRNSGQLTEDEVAVFETITKSHLLISDIELYNFCICETILNFMYVKGQFLKSLTLSTFISTGLIQSLGKYCCNVSYLHIFEFHHCNTPNTADNVTFDSNMIIFSTLKVLNLRGKLWNPNIILPIILPHAHKLQYLEIEVDRDNNVNDSIDKTVNKLLVKNPLNKLVKMCAGFYSHITTVLYFARLPHIRKLYFWYHTDFMSLSEIENLIKEMKNRDTSIDIRL